MVRKLRIKLFKKSNNCVYIIVGFNKKSRPMNFIEKIGVIMVLKKKKYIFFSLKKLGYWLNKGASLNTYVSFLITLLLFKRQQSLNAFFIKKNKK